MTKKDYERFAIIFHEAFVSPDANWPEIYDHIYTPMVMYFEAENPCFNPTRFAYAVASGNNELLEYLGAYDQAPV